jgi:hypothetical protein
VVELAQSELLVIPVLVVLVFIHLLLEQAHHMLVAVVVVLCTVLTVLLAVLEAVEQVAVQVVPEPVELQILVVVLAAVTLLRVERAAALA